MGKPSQVDKKSQKSLPLNIGRTKYYYHLPTPPPPYLITGPVIIEGELGDLTSSKQECLIRVENTGRLEHTDRGLQAIRDR